MSHSIKAAQWNNTHLAMLSFWLDARLGHGEREWRFSPHILKILGVVKGKMEKYCFGTYLLYVLPFLFICANTLADEGLRPAGSLGSWVEGCILMRDS